MRDWRVAGSCLLALGLTLLHLPAVEAHSMLAGISEEVC